MNLCSILNGETPLGGVLVGERILTFPNLSTQLQIQIPSDLLSFIRDPRAVSILKERSQDIARVADRFGKLAKGTHFAPPYLDPPKIWGIGLNYREHADDLGAESLDEPASFMKPSTTVIGPGASIALPPQSNRVTAEAELGIIIGKLSKNINEVEAEDAVFGFVPILDMTAEDILRRNPRFLTRSKSFDTFFSFGPAILTPDEVTDLPELAVSTVRNGEVVRSNKVKNMRFPPHQLISFHSHVMTLEPGDIISTGTPGAAVIKNGDRVECKIAGFPTLSNIVVGDH
jgi:2-keto-4-pentenoate hydratase/2-oxohepta-3-ene-1,7-dioic acid hydratase in catechol pathway